VQEGPNVPAKWSGWEQQPAGGADKAKPKAPVKPKATVKPRATIKPKAKAIPKAGKGKDAKKDEKPKPSFKFPEDGIPRPPKLKAPALEKSGPFSRLPDQLPGVGKSEAAVKMVFEDLEKGEVAPEVLEVDDGFVVLQVLDRESPDMDSFTKQEPELRRLYLSDKARETVKSWVAARCQEAVEKKKVSFAKSYLEFQDDKNKPLPIRYQPCSNLGRF
jgi:hypothetical protein